MSTLPHIEDDAEAALDKDGAIGPIVGRELVIEARILRQKLGVARARLEHFLTYHVACRDLEELQDDVRCHRAIADKILDEFEQEEGSLWLRT